MTDYSDFADIDGGRLYYESQGEGETVVLLHGFATDTRLWQRQIPALAQHYRVIAYDQRGYGRSSLPDAPYAPYDDLAGLLDWLSVAAAHLIGLSRGGGVALDFAIAYPDRVRSLVLVDTMLGGYRWSAEFRVMNGDVAATARDVGLTQAREQWLKTPLLALAWQVEGAGEHCAQMLADYSGWHWLNSDPARSLRPPAIERLGEVVVPTLVAVGEQDIPDFRAIADRLAAGVPGARLVVLPGVGHMSNVEDPVTFNRIVLSFLGQSVAASDHG